MLADYSLDVGVITGLSFSFITNYGAMWQNLPPPNTAHTKACLEHKGWKTRRNKVET